MTCKAVQWLKYISISKKFLGGKLPKINDSSTNSTVQWFPMLALRSRLNKSMIVSPLTANHPNRHRTRAGRRRLLAPILFLSLLFSPTATLAQSTLISNTGQTMTGLGDVFYAWYNGFTTGTYALGYNVTSIKLKVTIQSGTTADYSLSIYDDSSGAPGSSLVTLDNPASLATGEIEFTVPTTTYPNGYELSANTTYHIVIVDTVGAASELKLDGTSADGEDSGGASGWSIANAAYLKDGESSEWEQPAADYALQFAVVGNSIPPIATITPSGTVNMVTEQSLVLTGSGSDPDGGDVSNPVWNLTDNDGNDVTDTEATLLAGSDNYQKILLVSTAGTYKVTLTVTDDESVEGTTTLTAVVAANVAPTATIMPSGPVTILRNTAARPSSLNLDGSGSDAGNIGDDITYTWTATDTSDDDVTDVVLTNADMPTATFSSDVTDTYEVKLIVEDNGLLTGTATVTVTTVVSHPPTAEITTSIPVSHPTGDALLLSGTGSEPEDTNATITFAWTAENSAGTDVSSSVISNETTGTNNTTTATFTAATADTYTVKLTATDDDSQTGEATVSIKVVVNQLPVVTISPSDSASVDAGKDLTLEGIVTDDDPIASYAWSVRDGTNPVTGVLSSTDTATTTFNSDTPGTYTVTLAAVDDQGGESMASVTITVTDPLVISSTAISLDEEDAMGSWTVALNSAPTSAVTVDIVSDATSVALITPSSLSFDVTNWSEPQTVTVITVDDDPNIITEDRTANVSHTITGVDYTNAPAATVVVTAVDDDFIGMKLSLSTIDVIEGHRTGTWTVRLQTEPTEDVTVTVADSSATALVSFSDSGDCDTDSSPSTMLTFSITNWDQPQTVTVCVDDDTIDNANDRTTTITHTAEEGGVDYDGDYDNAAVVSVMLTAVDDDERGIVTKVPDQTTSLTILEGRQGSYTIRLGSQPIGGNVTVTATIAKISGSDMRTLAFGDSTLFPLTFTATDWDAEIMVDLSAGNDDTPRTVDTIYTVTHTASGADYGSVSTEVVTITIPGYNESGTGANRAVSFPIPSNNMLRVPVDQDLPPEFAGATLDFQSGVTPTSQVTLSGTSLVPDIYPEGFDPNSDVLVNISFKDGDIEEFNGVVHICLPKAGGGGLFRWNEQAEPGEWWEALPIPEGNIPSGYACGVATSFSLFATGPLPEAPVAPPHAVAEVEPSRLAQLGRVMAGQVMDAVQGRLGAPRDAGFKATMAGYSLPSFDESTAVPAFVSSAQNGLGSGSAAMRDWQHTQVQALTDQSLLSGSSFSLTGQSRGLSSASIWGQASVSGFDGQGLKDGQMSSSIIGADWSSEKLTTGFVLSHSQGDGTWISTSTPEDEGVAPVTTIEEFESAMTGIHPYFGYEFSNRMTVWGLAGYGQGDIETTAGEQMASADMDMLMLAGGTNGVLNVPAFMSDDVLLTLNSDVLWASMGSEAENSSVSRLRMALELSRYISTSGEGELRPSAELGLRLDGGDAETGMGFDVGLGLEWRNPASGVRARLQGRGLLTHEDNSLRERGFSGSFGWNSRPGSAEGSNLTMSYSLGGASSGGAKELFSRDTLSSVKTLGDDLGNHRMEIRFGYGMPVLGGRFIGTPQTALGYAEDKRDVSLGWRMTLVDRSAVRSTGSLGLSVEARRIESASDGYRPEDEIVFRLRTQF